LPINDDHDCDKLLMILFKLHNYINIMMQLLISDIY